MCSLGILIQTMNNQSSYGQSLLGEFLSKMVNSSFAENYRPAWLMGLELDFYSETLRLGFEFQGAQHFVPILGAASLMSQQQRDSSKKRICKERDVVLLRVDASDLTISRIRFLMKYHGFKSFLLPQKHARKVSLASIEYRKTLRLNFDCPTSRRRKTRGRKESVQRSFLSDKSKPPRQIPLTPPRHRSIPPCHASAVSPAEKPDTLTLIA